MDEWERMLEAQEAERNKLRVNQITVEVEEKKKSKSKVYNVKKTIQYGLVHRSLDDETLIGKYELYFADLDMLTQQDRIQDNTIFGELADEHAVAQAIFPYLAQHYPHFLEESPFAISYNPIAEAWIVEGSLPAGMLGGVIYIALTKEEGKLIMMYGTR